MKIASIVIGILLLAFGLVAGLVAAVSTEEWQQEKDARVAANISSGVKTLANTDKQEDTAVVDMLGAGFSDKHRQLHNQRMGVLAISSITGVCSLVGGVTLLIVGLVLKRKTPGLGIVPPRL